MTANAFRGRISSLLAAGIAVLSLLGALALMQGTRTAIAAPQGPPGPPPTIHLVPVAEGFDEPTDIANSGLPGDARLFVVEKAGVIRIMTGTGAVEPTPFLSITQLVRSQEFERGLLGLTFHPDFENNGYFYVNYTYVGDSDEALGDTRISRFQVSGGDPNQADPASESVILMVPQPVTYTTHNAGDLAFGPDGYLYIPMGDGGGIGDPGDRAQDLGEMLGKILRIDVDGGSPYTIPLDNPYVGQAGVREEIWASGLRNPWRFSFDRATGDLYLADVGQFEWEEVNFQAAASSGGENYGWRCYEGSHDYNTTGCGPITDYDGPAVEYSHAEGHSVVGGYVYRGGLQPEMDGHYFFGDFTNGRLWSMHPDGASWQVKEQGIYPGSSFSSFGEDVAGELYVADFENSAVGSGVVFRIENLELNLFLPIAVKPNP